MNEIEKALEMALKAHECQTDKAGETYIKHPISVMQSVETEEEKVVALLHDVVEDSMYSLKDLEGDGIRDLPDYISFSEDILNAVKALTKRDDESYSKFIDRCKENDIAREVKKADIRDNLDLSRLDEVTEKDLERVKKYHKSLEELSVKNEVSNNED